MPGHRPLLAADDQELIADAVSKGLFEVRPGADDHRKRIVCPTERTVAEYVAWCEDTSAFSRRPGRTGTTGV